ncbi:Ig-like domain-containing protein, partial [Pseudomonas chlororaphis]|uniref:Ig-like domain-containing protein n=1 Tax=Pseudomonas chlororaphis TaxID=587753 RepID=UPI001C82B33E
PPASIAVAATRQMAATVAPAGASQAVTWSSGTPGVATVNSAGLVTGVSAGTSVITATSVADGTKAGTATITITA